MAMVVILFLALSRRLLNIRGHSVISAMSVSAREWFTSI